MAKYTREILAEAAANSTSIAGVLRFLGLRQAGGMHAYISRRLKALSVDISHFTGQVHNRGKPAKNRLSPGERLIALPAGANRTPGHRLLAALLAIGRPECCEACGGPAIWQGKPLRLQVDHHNGDILDNRPANLRLLCPNCHSQTPTFANKKRSGLDSIPIAGVV